MSTSADAPSDGDAGTLAEPLLGDTKTDTDTTDQPPVLTCEPGEAQREAWAWPRARPGAARPQAAESRLARYGRCALQALGGILGIGGVTLSLSALVPWQLALAWVKHRARETAGVGISLLGAVVFMLARPAVLEPGELEWDGKALKTPEGKQLPNFTFVHWNDVTRFQADKEELQKLFSSREDDDELLSSPEVQILLEKAETTEKNQRAKWSADAHKAILERCRTDLEAGMSARRLRQKLHPRIFVLDFVDGQNADSSVPSGLQAQIQQLRDAVSFLLTVCSPYDEAVLRISSPGGLVSEYGLASAQLMRLRKAGVRLTACVDSVAASGGYMMACVAQHIVAAPFAVLGSIGVVASMPNFHRVLQKQEVDYLEVTAGKFKRTVGILTENTKEGIEHFQSELDAVHAAFTDLVTEGRGSKIVGGASTAATGETFLAGEALGRGLVDELGTSDGYLRRRAAEGADVIVLRPGGRRGGWMPDLWRSLIDLSSSAKSLASRLGDAWRVHPGAAPSLLHATATAPPHAVNFRV